MNNSLSAVAIGHFVMKVSDIDISYQFYTKLGLRPFGIYSDLAVVELRGGTHILLLSKNDEFTSSLSSSQLGQRGGASFNANFQEVLWANARVCAGLRGFAG